ncbi:hypothetical protein [Dactylosporangium fulvum]|uniref:Uncharacterized protein n=1 Tax=Dactylosporangium fulvum TaxID=53359 RepID=A0ABY5VWJ1_9ACTN|nr:hypothetical protein [Dactylosporangium fulvum]UWP82117.1 hypothetical protein Dfulv_44815 [Dactylosporangium fulvum]
MNAGGNPAIGSPTLITVVIVIVVAMLLRRSLRLLRGTVADVMSMFKVLVNLAMTALLLVGVLGLIFVWAFVSASGA